ncbi:MAG: hypothetical protein IT534_09815 [Bauldia sp.]|jgi:hypothetical protein|nr:hypothetical protein [Bauldia sp.]
MDVPGEPQNMTNVHLREIGEKVDRLLREVSELKTRIAALEMGQTATLSALRVPSVRSDH